MTRVAASRARRRGSAGRSRSRSASWVGRSRSGARRIDELEETAKLVDGAGGRGLVSTLDVTDPTSVDAFYELVTREAGPIDVLVNNAGTARPGFAHEMLDEHHRQIIETNLLGPILMTRRMIGALRAAGATTGDIVFISSDATVHPRPAMAPYLSTKAALETFAQTLALECEGTEHAFVGRARRPHGRHRLRGRLGPHDLRGAVPALAALRHPAPLPHDAARRRRSRRRDGRHRAAPHVGPDRRGPAQPPLGGEGGVCEAAPDTPT